MYRITNYKNLNLKKIKLDKTWNFEDKGRKELLMHKIHSYPAKFPYFFLDKAINYYRRTENNKKAINIADIFCGCGTLALEAKKRSLNFWGCDINPVATLIAKVKSETYQSRKLKKYYEEIINQYTNKNSLRNTNKFFKNHQIIYWFHKEKIKELAKLKNSIEEKTPKGKYRNFFLCAFSNILKPTSKWFTKSIKPQIDHCKTPACVIDAFSSQYEFMFKANKESIELKSSSKTKIVKKNIVKDRVLKNCIDLIVSSPPYAVSYEYADIHQLSALWLEYAKDYRELRKGAIGSTYQYEQNISNKKLPDFAIDINKKLSAKDTTKAKSVAKYFLDIDRAISQAKKMLQKNGMTIFIIGNPRYKGVLINNLKFFVFSMQKNGFQNIQIAKRKISYKNLTPYRDKIGRFTKQSGLKKVYNYEFIVTGQNI